MNTDLGARAPSFESSPFSLPLLPKPKIVRLKTRLGARRGNNGDEDVKGWRGRLEGRTGKATFSHWVQLWGEKMYLPDFPNCLEVARVLMMWCNDDGGILND